MLVWFFHFFSFVGQNLVAFLADVFASGAPFTLMPPLPLIFAALGTRLPAPSAAVQITALAVSRAFQMYLPQFGATHLLA